jgi:hypothetical protein
MANDVYLRLILFLLGNVPRELPTVVIIAHKLLDSKHNYDILIKDG